MYSAVSLGDRHLCSSDCFSCTMDSIHFLCPAPKDIHLGCTPPIPGLQDLSPTRLTPSCFAPQLWSKLPGRFHFLPPHPFRQSSSLFGIVFPALFNHLCFCGAAFLDCSDQLSCSYPERFLSTIVTFPESLFCVSPSCLLAGSGTLTCAVLAPWTSLCSCVLRGASLQQRV